MIKLIMNLTEFVSTSILFDKSYTKKFQQNHKFFCDFVKLSKISNMHMHMH